MPASSTKGRGASEATVLAHRVLRSRPCFTRLRILLSDRDIRRSVFLRAHAPTPANRVAHASVALVWRPFGSDALGAPRQRPTSGGLLVEPEAIPWTALPRADDAVRIATDLPDRRGRLARPVLLRRRPGAHADSQFGAPDVFRGRATLLVANRPADPRTPPSGSDERRTALSARYRDRRRAHRWCFHFLRSGDLPLLSPSDIFRGVVPAHRSAPRGDCHVAPRWPHRRHRGVHPCRSLPRLGGMESLACPIGARVLH